VTQYTALASIDAALNSFAKEVITFVCSGNFINLSQVLPSDLYLRDAGYKGGSQFITDVNGSLFMCLTSGCCVTSHLTDVQQAPTARGSAQNYFKYIDVRPHTVEYEQMCASIGMAACQKFVETSLIGSNAIRIHTRSWKSCT
jgi:hypothetical protein